MKRTLYLLPIALIALVACSESEPIGTPIRQYADFVIDQSSEYNPTGSWSAEKILGKENVYPAFGDKVEAWASVNADDDREWLILGFDSVQTVRTIEIYETYNPGAIDTVYVRNSFTRKWKKIYSRPAVVLGEGTSRKFTIYFEETDFDVDAIRIALNSGEVPGWNEIDAVAISGFIKDE